MAMPLTCEASALTSLGPLEIPDLAMGPCHSIASIIEACIVSPSPSAVTFARVSAFVLGDQPLEVEFEVVGTFSGPRALEFAARSNFIRAQLTVVVETAGWRHTRTLHCGLVPVRPSDIGWIARALIHPASWVGAASVTVTSFSLAGRPLPCARLPSTLRVGYNHAPAPAGAVFAAAQAGDAAALQFALKSGASTEEADEVLGEHEWLRTRNLAVRPFPCALRIP